MMRQPDETAQVDLREALREIQLMAGLVRHRHGSAPAEDEGRSLTIGITSPRSGDGKTTVAIALAGSLVRDLEEEVLLADLDFQTHSVGRQYGLEGESGLGEVLAGTATLETVSHRLNGPMSVVPAGNLPPDPGRLAHSEQLTALLTEMKGSHGYVIFDLPSTLDSMNAPALARRCDAVLVVVRWGETTRQELDRVLELLHESHVLGIVINRRRSMIPRWVSRSLGLAD